MRAPEVVCEIVWKGYLLIDDNLNVLKHMNQSLVRLDTTALILLANKANGL